MQNSIKVTHNQYFIQLECTCGWSAKALPSDEIGSWILAHHEVHNVGVRILKDRLEGLDEMVKSEVLHDKIASA